MGHSVREHLGIELQTYDETIRRFIPGYETMLQVAAHAAVAAGPARILDLGAGTGALSEALLAADSSCIVELIDVDAGMLEHARARLEPYSNRVRFSELSFHGPLPRCDSVTASLALHHVQTLTDKRGLYRRVHGALGPDGVFVNADAAVPVDHGPREETYWQWVEHMAAHGIEEMEAVEHLAKWAEEDTYFSLAQELAAVEAAGFDATCIWRQGPLSVVVGRKHAQSRR